MSDLTRRINAVLGQTLGVQVTPGRNRAIRLGADWFVRLLYFERLLDAVSSVPGDVVECGVADGSSLAMLGSLMRANGQLRDEWGFDSWEGLPPPSEADLTLGESIASGGMFEHASIRRVHEEFAGYGWSEQEIQRSVRLVPGLFEQTLPKFSGAIALLHVDADLYDSYHSCLTNLWPQLGVGGIAAFDEYDEPDLWPGARRAVDEFLGSLPGGAAELCRDDRSGKWWARKQA